MAKLAARGAKSACHVVRSARQGLAALEVGHGLGNTLKIAAHQCRIMVVDDSRFATGTGAVVRRVEALMRDLSSSMMQIDV
jgi:hypothetical protein